MTERSHFAIADLALTALSHYGDALILAKTLINKV